MLEIHGITVGPFQENCYFLIDKGSGDMVIVDPGDEPDRLLEMRRRLGNGRIVEIWNTHGHIDHINANAAIKGNSDGAPISIHEIEEEWLQSAELNLAAMAGLPFVPSTADRTWQGGETLHAVGREWEIHHVPGHSPGMCAIVCREEKIMLGGDLLFAGSIGRYDFPTSEPKAMIESIRGLFTEWGEDDWTVYPGHGPETTVGHERNTNVLVKAILEEGRLM